MVENGQQDSGNRRNANGFVFSPSVSTADYPAQVSDWKARRPVGDWMSQFSNTGVDVTGARILDCGCGPGHYGPLLLDAGARSVIGLDRESRCLDQAKAGGSYLGLVRAMAEALPFRDGCADVVLLRYVIHHAEDPAKRAILEELQRVLSDKGRLVVETSVHSQFGKHHDHQIFPRLTEITSSMYPSVEALAALVLEAGFKDVRFIESVQHSRPYESVEAALERSRRLVEMGIGPTPWLRLDQNEREEFHKARLRRLPEMFGSGPVPRTWHGTFMIGTKSGV